MTQIGNAGEQYAWQPWTTKQEHLAAALRRRLSHQDTEYFANRYLNDEPWTWLRSFDAALAEPGHRVKVVMAPVDQGKTVRTQANVLRRICMNRHERIAWVMWTKPLARARVDAIRQRLLTNELLIRDYWDSEAGPFFSNPDEAGSADRFTVRRPEGTGPQAIASATLTALGLKENMEGEKYTLMVLDDPINQRHISSRADRDAAWRVMETTIVNRVEPGGQIWLIGAPWNEDDLYHRAVERLRAKLYRFDAILEELPETWPTGPLKGLRKFRPLCPERFGTYGEGLHERGYGTSYFMLKYRCNAKAFQGGTFQPVRVVSREYVEQAGVKELSMGFDPNNSTEDDADWTAIASLARLGTGEVCLLRAYRAHLKTGWGQHIANEHDILRALYPKAVFHYVEMESNNFQDQIRIALHKERPDIRARPLHRRLEKKLRITTKLEPWLNVPDRFSVQRGAPHSQDFLDEARAFPYGTYDLLDAVEAALRPWNQKQPAKKWNTYYVEL